MLVITYNRITINGYSEDQLPLFGNDKTRPLKAYSEKDTYT